MKKLLYLFLIVYAFSIITGCSSNIPIETERKYKIVIMPKLIGTPYFNSTEYGAKMAGKDLGVDVNFTGPTKVDSAEQVKILEDLINTDIDCIAVAPNDPMALTSVLRKAKAKGILVVDWDTSAKKEVVDLSVRAVNDIEFSHHIWDLLAENIDCSNAKYAIITGGLSAANLNSWIYEGLRYSAEKYPNLKLVTDKIPTDEKAQLSYQKTLDVIKGYPDLNGIIGISVFASLGAAQAISEEGLQDKIALVGCALPKDSRQYILDGSFDGATGWDPVKLGYTTIYAAKKKLDGINLINAQFIPNVGQIVVRDYGNVIIMRSPPQDFTKENIDIFK